MKIPLSCIECGREQQDSGPQPAVFFLADVTDDGLYSGKCDKGHELATSLQNEKYEVLFQSAVIAFLYGFHREAVASAATALERFFEFSCRVAWQHLGVSREIADSCWKPMGRASQQQLGAFRALYLLVFGDPFPEKELKAHLNVRNDTVHYGKIPTREKAEKFLRETYNMMEKTRLRFQESAKDAWESTMRAGISARQAALHARHGAISGTFLATFVTSTGTVGEDRTFEGRVSFLLDSLGMHMPELRPTK